MEHPLEAGLPPRVDVLDEVSSAVAFEHRWAAFQDDLLADPALARPLLLLFACGAKPRALRALAAAFEDNWDLIEERVPEKAPGPPPVQDLLRLVLASIKEVCSEPCQGPGDKLRARLDDIGEYMDALAAISDEVELVEALAPGAQPKRPSFNVATICSCWRGPWCAGRTYARCCTRATGGSCSTSSRTPIPSRSSWPCG
jgi:hypothetical protein